MLLSLPLSHIAALEESGDPAGVRLSRLRTDIDRSVGALLMLGTTARVTGATLAGAWGWVHFEPSFFVLLLAALVLVFFLVGEVVPRSLGSAYARELAAPAAASVRAVVLLLRPLLFLLGWLRAAFLPAGQLAPVVTRGEMEVMAEIGRREEPLDEAEWTVVSNVINLDQLAVNEVMTPRTSIVALPVDSSLEAAKDLMLTEGHLRLPVYEGTIDRVVGVLLARDVWRADREGVVQVREVVRPPTFVPGSKPVEELIREMRLQRIKMAIVLDEYGGTAGLVTLEDLIEQIVGEIQDEHEQEPLPFDEAMEGEVRIRGDVPIWEVNARFGLQLPEDLYDTIGGFVFGQLGRIALPGDEVALPQGVFRVVAMDGRRVERVAFSPTR